MCARQKIRTNHLQAVSPGFVRPQHQTRRFQGVLDHGQLALIEFEIENLPGLRLPPGEMAFNFSFKPSLGNSLALCNQVAQSDPFPSLLATLTNSVALLQPTSRTCCLESA